MKLSKTDKRVIENSIVLIKTKINTINDKMKDFGLGEIKSIPRSMGKSSMHTRCVITYIAMQQLKSDYNKEINRKLELLYGGSYE